MTRLDGMVQLQKALKVCKKKPCFALSFFEQMFP